MSAVVRALILIGVVALGWAAALALLGYLLGLSFMQDQRRTYLNSLFVTALVLIPGGPAGSAWLAARRGWTAMAWILGGAGRPARRGNHLVSANDGDLR